MLPCKDSWSTEGRNPHALSALPIVQSRAEQHTLHVPVVDTVDDSACRAFSHGNCTQTTLERSPDLQLYSQREKLLRASALRLEALSSTLRCGSKAHYPVFRASMPHTMTEHC